MHLLKNHKTPRYPSRPISVPMTKDPKTLWANCLTAIKRQISSQSYQTWFAPIIPYKYEKNTLTILVPNQFFYEWLESHYLNLLQQVVHEEIGPKACLAYQLISSPQNDPQNLAPTKIPLKNQMHTNDNNPLNPHFTFANLVVGDFNQLAQATAHAVANNPGKTSFNPFLIHGPTGLGKTHIAQAIAHEVKAKSPQNQVAYTTAEQFTNQFIQKIQENKVQVFVHKYSQVNLLIIDDIQFFKRKEKTQEIFLQILNRFRQKNKQIIMTTDVPPSDLQGFEKRVLSRLKWGLTVDLQQPSLETRIAIIQSKLQQNNFTLEPEHIHYVATHVETNIRELEGVLISLIAHVNLIKKKKIDKPLLKQIISKIVEPQQEKPELNIQHIQKIVTNHFKISLEKLKSKSRKQEIVIPRQLIMYLARKYTSNSLKVIGQFLGRKDHSTVNYALNAVTQRIATNKNTRSQVQTIEKIIQQNYRLPN